MPEPINFVPAETTLLSGFGEWTFGNAGDTAKRTWLMQADRDVTAADGDAAYSACPAKVGDALYAGDTTRYCTKVTIKAIAGVTDALYAEAEYGANELEQNPLLRKDTIALEVAGETVDWFKDADGKYAVNTANEPFDKLPPRTTGGVKLVIEGNRSTLPAAAMVGLSRPHRINGGSITVRGITIGEGQAKLTGCSGSEQTENGVTYYRCRWELTLAESWDLELDSRGLNELNDDKKPTPIRRGANNTPVETAWPLDDKGKSLAAQNDEPATVKLKPYKRESFNFGWTASA